MKIAIIRGQYLNKFEMQNFEPLTNKHELVAYIIYGNKFKVSNIQIPTKKLRSIEDLSRFSFGYLRRVIEKFIYKFKLENYIFGLEKELHGYDIVHVAETSTRYSYQVIKLKKKVGFKVITTVWENIPYREECFSPRNIYYCKKVVRDLTDIFLAVTQKTRESLILEGVNEKKIRVVYPGVDLLRFKWSPKNKNLLQKIGFSEKDFVVLFIGRLVWEKGIYELIFSAKKFIEDLEIISFSPKFLIIGDGKEHKNIIRLLNNLGLYEYFKVIGEIEYSEMHSFYNLADIFVLPSQPTKIWQEQFGMVLVEAMASGIPVISTLSGSIPEVVGDAGLLIPSGDFMALYHAMKKLMLDKSLRKELSKKGRERAEKKFDAVKYAKQIENIYQELIM